MIFTGKRWTTDFWGALEAAKAEKAGDTPRPLPVHLYSAKFGGTLCGAPVGVDIRTPADVTVRIENVTCGSCGAQAMQAGADTPAPAAAVHYYQYGVPICGAGGPDAGTMAIKWDEVDCEECTERRWAAELAADVVTRVIAKRDAIEATGVQLVEVAAAKALAAAKARQAGK